MKKLRNFVSPPRVIGVLLIIIGLLAYKTQGFFRTSMLFVAGLVLVLAGKKLAVKYWQEFLKSFRLKKEFLYTIFFDVLFWAVLAVSVAVVARVLRTSAKELATVSLQGRISPELISSNVAIMKSFLTTALIVVIIFWFVTIIAYSISRGLIWLNLAEQKRGNWVFFVRFASLNIVWCTAWLVLALFLLTSMKQNALPYVFLLLLILYPHLTSVLHYSYVRTRWLGSAVKNAFSTGLGKIGRFVHPYCYFFVVYIIISQAQKFARGRTGLVILFLIVLAFMAWYRTYLRNVLRELA